MLNILELVSSHARRFPHRPAVVSREASLTYRELEDYSDRLALYLGGRCRGSSAPVVVYGHKHPFMLVCFLACVKAGHAYCPVDVSVPPSRVQMILDTAAPPLTLAIEPLPASCSCPVCLELEEIRELLKEDKISSREIQVLKQSLRPVEKEETFYIIFTSGSTGVPKGVQISADCLNHYLEWSVSLGSSEEEKQGLVFLNQAPFSFDLSVMDTYTCLACGGTLWCLDKETQKDYRLLLDSLKRSQASVFVATPSFGELCLADPGFSQETLPSLSLFLFCGEALSNKTAKKLLCRFPKAKLFNTYGPTESTVAITQTEITPQLCLSSDPLPVGVCKPGTWVEIQKENGQPAAPKEKGEIVIWGDTVSPGYFKNPFLTKKAFLQKSFQGRLVRGYRTGDMGYLDGDTLYCCGRMDRQVKLHGYRIELEDIENNLLKLPHVSSAAVLPHIRDNKIKSLYAYVVCPKKEISDKGYASILKEELLALLPEYMIPKKFFFLDRLPVTGNGKVDRKLLRSLVS